MGSYQAVPGAVDLVELRRPEEASPSVSHLGFQNIVFFRCFQSLNGFCSADIQLPVGLGAVGSSHAFLIVRTGRIVISVVFIIEDMGIRPLFNEGVGVGILLNLSGDFIDTLFSALQLFQIIFLPDHSQILCAAVTVRSSDCFRQSNFFSGLGGDFYRADSCILHGSILLGQRRVLGSAGFKDRGFLRRRGLRDFSRYRSFGVSALLGFQDHRPAVQAVRQTYIGSSGFILPEDLVSFRHLIVDHGRILNLGSRLCQGQEPLSGKEHPLIRIPYVDAVPVIVAGSGRSQTSVCLAEQYRGAHLVVGAGILIPAPFYIYNRFALI